MIIFPTLRLWLRGRAGRARRIIARALFVSALVACALALVGPLTYDNAAHTRLNDAVRAWSPLGNQLLGIDITMPRQNLFSLARDLDRVVPISDHGTLHRTRMFGVVAFVTRGSLHTVADMLRWFDVPLTATQARMLNLCRSVDDVHESEIIVVQPDPFQLGIASWYGPGFHGRLAASGEIYNMYDRTAAHRTLPLQSLVRVVHQRTGVNTVVRINDRGPYVGGRIIDMSRRAMDLLGAQDLAAVYIERLDPTALDIECR